MVRRERVGLVLLDILMRGGGGLEVLQELKGLGPGLPVIMVAGVKAVRTTVAAMKLGASDYLTKPFQEEELRAAIRRALEQRTSRLSASVDRDRPGREAQRLRTHRLLRAGGDPGWRPAPAATLAPPTTGET